MNIKKALRKIFITTVFFIPSSAYAADYPFETPIECVGGFCPDLTQEGVGLTLESIFTTLLGVFTVVAGLLLLIYFMLGAIGWITAGGDEEKLKKSRAQITNAVMGLILVVAAYSIIYLLGEVLGLPILNPASMLNDLR